MILATIIDLKVFFTKNISINEAERNEDEFSTHLGALKKYNLNKPEYTEEQEKLLENAKEIMMEEKRLLKGLKIKHFK